MKPTTPPLITPDMKEVAYYSGHGRAPAIRHTQRYTATTVIVCDRPFYLANGREKGGYVRAEIRPVTDAVRDHIAADALSVEIANAKRAVESAAAKAARNRIADATISGHDVNRSAASLTLVNLKALLAEYEAEGERVK